MFGGIKTEVTVLLLPFSWAGALEVCGVDIRLHARSPDITAILVIAFFVTVHHKRLS